MATRIPLVIVNGQVQQLQNGDQIMAATAMADTRTLTSAEASVAATIGTPVYISGAGLFKRAQANALTTSKVVGLVYDTSIASGASGMIVVNGMLTATTTQWDAITGQTGGLTAGASYYLDPTTIGKMTATAPTTPGQVVAMIGVALSTTDFDVDTETTVLL